MAELHTNLYIKHPSQNINKLLPDLFFTFRGPEAEIEVKLLNTATAISETNAEVLVKNLLSTINELPGTLNSNLIPESKDVTTGGYHCFHFVHGRWGDDVISKLIEFFGVLVPDADIRAWLYGDDDPWEMLYRFQDGKVITHYHEPDMDDYFDDEEDKAIALEDAQFPDVYIWWHEGVTTEIQEGFIYQWLNQLDWENEYIVLSGKFEELEDYGANMQSSISKRTTLLVTGQKVGASKLKKAKELDIRIITENELMELMD